MANETRTSTGSNEEEIVRRLDLYKRVQSQRIESRRRGAFKEIGETGIFSTGRPVPNEVNPASILERVKMEKSIEQGAPYLEDRAFEFEQMATQLLDEHGTLELMPYSSPELDHFGKGLKRTLPPVKFEFQGRPAALHLVEGIKENGQSMGFTLDVSTTTDYDEIRLATLGESPSIIRNWRNEIARAQEADTIIGVLQFMQRSLNNQTPPTA